MRIHRRLALFALYAMIAGLLAACGGKSSSTNTPANVRLVNATASAPLTLDANGVSYIGSTSAATVSNYVNIEGGTYTIGVLAADGSLTSFNAQSASYGAGDYYTTVAYQRNGAIQAVTLADSVAAPNTGFITFRVYNASSDPGPVDVYITAPGVTLNQGVAPNFQFVGGGALSGALSLTQGTYQIVVTGYGNQSDVRLSIPAVPIANPNIVTLVLTSTTGGALVDGVLVDQGGYAAFYPNTNARVRLVTSIAGTGSVVATVGSTALSTVTLPTIAVPSYTLVNSGSQAFGVTVNGTAVAGLSTLAPAAGGDYTVLVYGTTAAPAVTVLTDVNQAVGISGNSSVRLVNAGISGYLALTVNQTSVASAVPIGTASSYTGVASSTAAYFALTASPSVALTQIPNNGNVDLLSGGVYTLFELGATTAPLLNKDR
ncbi:MAG TPA: DUF4397 domain-containing protein [Burkholderiaceae bacterium]|nr:DUF4397 domain-containing protein [Burkholderiaceae bacterium]